MWMCKLNIRFYTSKFVTEKMTVEKYENKYMC